MNKQNIFMAGKAPDFRKIETDKSQQQLFDSKARLNRMKAKSILNPVFPNII